MESVNLSLNIERKRVLAAGGGMVGCETAHPLATYGRDVTIVEALPERRWGGVSRAARY